MAQVCERTRPEKTEIMVADVDTGAKHIQAQSAMAWPQETLGTAAVPPVWGAPGDPLHGLLVGTLGSRKSLVLRCVDERNRFLAVSPGRRA